MDNCNAECEKGLFESNVYCCSKPPQGGVSDRLILANWDNVDAFVVDPVTGIITEITFKPSTKAFAFIGVRGSNVPQATYTPTTYIPQYDHQVNFLAFETDQSAKTNIETLAQKKVIAIIEKTKGKSQGGDDSFEVFGMGVGLDLSELNYLPADPENGGAISIVIKSNDNQAKESNLPKSFFDTDYATTKAKLDAYLNLPAVLNISPIVGGIAGGDTINVTGYGFFEGGSSIVTAVDFVDSVGVVTAAASFAVASDTALTADTPALAAETYKVRVTTSNGVAESELVLVIS